MRKRACWRVRQTRTQISLRIRAVRTEYSLSAWKIFACLAIKNSSIEDSGQAEGMRRLIWILPRCTCQKVHFLTLGVVFINTLNICRLLCFLINYRLESLCEKLKDLMSNSVDPDETAHLDLRCLQKPIIIAYGSES